MDKSVQRWVWKYHREEGHRKNVSASPPFHTTKPEISHESWEGTTERRMHSIEEKSFSCTLMYPHVRDIPHFKEESDDEVGEEEVEEKEKEGSEKREKRGKWTTNEKEG